jgi:hypothetical protein
MSPNAGSRKRERESLLKRTEDSLHQKEVLLPEMQHRVGHVLVSYETSCSNWRLSVSDNGVGKQTDNSTPAKGDLATSLVKGARATA